jgi:hypothetical protein
VVAMADVVTFASNGWILSMSASGVSQSGRADGSHVEIAAAWRRRDCDAMALALALCAATVPLDLAASRICSLWKSYLQTKGVSLRRRSQIHDEPCKGRLLRTVL